MKRTKTLRQLREQRDRLLKATRDGDRNQLINRLYWRYKDNMLLYFHVLLGTPKSGGSIEWLFSENAKKLKVINDEPIYKWMYVK